MAAAVGLVVLTFAGCSGGGDGEALRASPLASGTAPPSTERPTAGEVGQGIRVVDLGFTEGQADTAACEQDPASDVFFPDGCATAWVTFGVVLENTTDQMVLDVDIVWTPVDDGGQPIDQHESIIVDEDGDPAGSRLRVGNLAPGQRMGIGDGHTIARSGVAEIRVEVEQPDDWMPEAAVDPRFWGDPDAEVTVSQVGIEWDENESATVSFDATLSSSLDQPVRTGGLTGVFYDAEGRIVGGANTFFDLTVSPGRTVPAEVDHLAVWLRPARTEIYLLSVRTTTR